MSVVRYRRNPATVWRGSSSFLVAAVPPQPPTRITGSAGLVWSLIEQPLTLDEIVVRLTASTAAAAPTVRTDTELLLRDLLPTGIVEEAPPCIP